MAQAVGNLEVRIAAQENEVVVGVALAILLSWGLQDWLPEWLPEFLRRNPVPLLFLLFLALMATKLAVGLWRQRGRQRALREVALQIGFSFQAADPLLERAGFTRLPMFEKWRFVLIRNVLRGSRAGREVAVFDFVYALRVRGRSSSKIRQTVFCFRLPGVSLPDFVLAPERTLTKLGWAGLGVRDINLEGNPLFSKNYLLRGPDEAAVRAIFEHGPAEFLAQEQYWHLQGSGEWVAMYHSTLVEEVSRPSGMASGLKKPEELPLFLEKAARIADLLAGAAAAKSAEARGEAGGRVAPRPTFADEDRQIEAHLKKWGERLGIWAVLAMIFFFLLLAFLMWRYWGR